MNKCCLCGKLDKTRQLFIDTTEYNFCEECIMTINTLEYEKSRQYVLDNMKNIEDTVLNDFLNNGIKQGLLDKKDFEEKIKTNNENNNDDGINSWISVFIIAIMGMIAYFIGIPLIIIIPVTMAFIWVSVQKETAKENEQNNQIKLSEAEKALQNLGFEDIKKVSYDGTILLALDTKNKKWCANGNYGKIFDFKQLISFELNENNRSIIKGTAGSSLIGAILAGSAGAIVGSSKDREIIDQVSSDIIIQTDDIECLQTVIHFYSSDIIDYEEILPKIREIISLLSYIVNENTKNNKENIKNEVSSNNINRVSSDNIKEVDCSNIKEINSIEDKLISITKLKDQGILTEEEYIRKKEELLNRI